MRAYKYNDTIEVLGASFNGVKEMIEYARKKDPKDGVYVGEDSQSYPCFDSSDYLYENRRYTNLVFATTRQELELKLKRLSGMRVLGSNYRKLTGALHPMLYWEGDRFFDVLLTESNEDGCSR